jgi:dTDP-4-dehydrorhamnose 3,5-epimerase/CDP-3, 6-dideoxy-D-glycero-D-glycero-4-hexulose-5-epimerase
MELIETPFDDCFLIKNNIIEDKRGMFVKTFSHSFFNDFGRCIDFKESLYTISNKNVIKGMHYQNCRKLVWVSYGEILDVIVCIDKKSLNYGKVFSTVLNNKEACLYINKGYAHGFKVVSDIAIVNYLIEDNYSSEKDKGVLWNSFNFDWGIKNPIVSIKDRKLPNI